ncbi:MAG: energy-coupling factor transporter transmembrane component T family protein [Promethearchaeota archaeon]
MSIVASIIEEFSAFINTSQSSASRKNSIHPSIKIVAMFVLLIAMMQIYSMLDFFLLMILLFMATIATRGFSKLFFKPVLLLFSFGLLTSLSYIIFEWKTFVSEINDFSILLIFQAGRFINKLLIFNFRLFSSIWLSRLFIFTTPIPDFLHGLYKLKIPKIFVDLFAITFRYIFLLAGEFMNIIIAKELRAPKIKSMKKRFSALGNVYAALLNRSLIRSKNVYLAMSLRGKPGNLMPRTACFSNKKSLLFSVVITAILVTNMFII